MLYGFGTINNMQVLATLKSAKSLGNNIWYTVLINHIFKQKDVIMKKRQSATSISPVQREFRKSFNEIFGTQKENKWKNLKHLQLFNDSHVILLREHPS